MTIQQINEGEYTRLVNQGVVEFRFAETYSNDVYFYRMMDKRLEAVLCIYKNNDGLMPVIKVCGNKIYVGYGHCVDIIEQSTLQNYGHHMLDSLVYDLLVASEQIIAILELDIVLFNSSGDILTKYNMNDIVVSYRICGNQLLVSTADGKELNIKI